MQVVPLEAFEPLKPFRKNQHCTEHLAEKEFSSTWGIDLWKVFLKHWFYTGVSSEKKVQCLLFAEEKESKLKCTPASVEKMLCSCPV